MPDCQNIPNNKPLTKHQLLKYLQDIEWDNFEVKTAKTDVPKDVWETVSAFSNSSGGWIVFGVSRIKKAFEIVGVDNPEKLENDVLTTLRSKTKFNIKLSPQAKRYKIDGKHVLTFYISSSDIKPVYFNGVQNTYIRTGSGDQQASEYEINALYRDQAFGSMSEKTVEGTSVEELMKTDESLPRNPVLAKFFRMAKLCESAGYGFDKIIDLISKDNSISITQLSTTTNITRSTIQKHINNLKNKGIIRREGAGKGGKWIIIKD